MATSPSFPQWLAREERLADRLPLRMSGTVGGSKTPPQTVEMIDLSPLGCRLRVAEQIPMGSYITLASGEAPRLEGWVAWSHPTECGVDFAQPLPHTVMESIAAPVSR